MEDTATDRLWNVAEIVGELTDFAGQAGDPASDMVLTVQDVAVAMPFELRVHCDDPGLSLSAAMAERMETSFSPQLASLRIRIGLNDD